MNEAATTQRPVPARLPIKATTRVKSWKDFKGYGFLYPPQRDETRDIFVHGSVVPARLGEAKTLRDGETVIVTYIIEDDGRLRATAIAFPDGPPAVPTLNPQPPTLNH